MTTLSEAIKCSQETHAAIHRLGDQLAGVEAELKLANDGAARSADLRRAADARVAELEAENKRLTQVIIEQGKRIRCEVHRGRADLCCPDCLISELTTQRDAARVEVDKRNNSIVYWKGVLASVSEARDDLLVEVQRLKTECITKREQLSASEKTVGDAYAKINILKAELAVKPAPLDWPADGEM